MTKSNSATGVVVGGEKGLVCGCLNESGVQRMVEREGGGVTQKLLDSTESKAIVSCRGRL